MYFAIWNRDGVIETKSTYSEAAAYLVRRAVDDPTSPFGITEGLGISRYVAPLGEGGINLVARALRLGMAIDAAFRKGMMP